MHPLCPFISTNLALFFHDVPSADWFRSILKTVRSIYNFISIQDVEAYYYSGKELNNCCLVTFDDGHRTFYENAFPVLREMNVPAALFVSPKIIGSGSNYWFQELDYMKTRMGDSVLREAVCKALSYEHANLIKHSLSSILKCMKIKDVLWLIESIKERHNMSIDQKFNITKAELRELKDSGLISIGAQTMNHPILSNETDPAVEREIGESVEELAQMINGKVSYFAYPNGKGGLDYGVREQSILQENNIELAFTTHTGFFTTKANPLAIPRGGFSGVKRENKAWVLAKLLLIPIWDKIGRGAEERERYELRSIPVPKFGLSLH